MRNSRFIRSVKQKTFALTMAGAVLATPIAHAHNIVKSDNENNNKPTTIVAAPPASAPANVVNTKMARIASLMSLANMQQEYTDEVLVVERLLVKLLNQSERLLLDLGDYPKSRLYAKIQPHKADLLISIPEIKNDMLALLQKVKSTISWEAVNDKIQTQLAIHLTDEDVTRLEQFYKHPMTQPIRKKLQAIAISLLDQAIQQGDYLLRQELAEQNLLAPLPSASMQLNTGFFKAPIEKQLRFVNAIKSICASLDGVLSAESHSPKEMKFFLNTSSEDIVKAINQELNKPSKNGGEQFFKLLASEGLAQLIETLTPEELDFIVQQMGDPTLITTQMHLQKAHQAIIEEILPSLEVTIKQESLPLFMKIMRLEPVFKAINAKPISKSSTKKTTPSKSSAKGNKKRPKK